MNIKELSVFKATTKPSLLELYKRQNQQQYKELFENTLCTKKNLTLSNFRGKTGANLPLGQNAIYENGGFTGAKLNVII